MSRASNSLKATDVTATPIKLKYSASYSETTICDSGIYAQTGINGPVTITGSIPEATLRYWSIRHLYYSNFLTGSYQVSGSSADNFLQSTAASGTFEGNTVASASADIRSFPTASGAKIKIINIPRSSFGEQVSKKSFFLASDDGTSYRLVDDGNGNIIDTLNNDVHVGNIIYAQGFVIITNSNYYCVMDGGPTTFPKYYTFDVTQSVKSFNPIIGAIPDCAPVDSSSLDLFEYPYYDFPRYSINSVGLVTLDSTDSLTSKVGTYKSFYDVQSTYCGTSDEQPITVELVDCKIATVSATKLACGVNGLSLTLVTPTPTPTATTPPPTPTVTAPPPTPTATIPPPTPTVTAPPPTPTVTAPPPTPTVTAPPPTPTATIPPPTPTATAGTITFTVNNPGTFPYPISAGNGSASGTITNNSGETIYVYSVFNSGGQNNGTISGDTGYVAGGIALDIPGGPITSFGQTFYSTNYETLLSDNTAYAWTLQKNDGYSTATLRLGYATTPGGSITLLAP